MRIPTGTPAAPTGGTNDMALASLLAAGVTWVIGWFGGCLIGFVLPFGNLCTGTIGLIATIVGIVAGHRALNQTRPGSPEAGSRWMAITGLALSYGSLALLAAIMCVALLLFAIYGTVIFTSADWSQLQDTLRATPTP